ncbi:MAG: response regulator [Nitrospirae bacterium]|nr:response regulator [Nitrospirota bacterium]
MPAENFDNNRLLERIHGKDSGRDIVLVVEDSPVTRLLTSRLVSAVLLGYEVKSAENGVEAIEMVKRGLGEQVAITVTDIDMPKMDGLYMARELKQLMPHVPIFVNSAGEEYATPGTEESAILGKMINAGIVDSFEKKPLGVDSVRAGIYRALRNLHIRIFTEARRA